MPDLFDQSSSDAVRCDPSRLDRVRLDRFMARANAAYYAARDPFADFTTAPEISQVFGELIGAWAAVCWQELGAPSPVPLIEAGPGRGTLMADALRLIGRVAPAFRTALRPMLIETSPRLRQLQRQRLPNAVWLDRLQDAPDGPSLLIANEFLDALPIRQFVRAESGWQERHVGSHGPENVPAATTDIPHAWRDDPPGSVREVCPDAVAFVRHVAQRCRRTPAAALLIDYGPAESAPGDSLQAMQAGAPADPFGEPGSRDLTAHVDFGALARVARSEGATVHGPTPQGLFLARLGLFPRTNALARSLPPAQAAAIMQATRRLSEPDQMGRLFKVMAISSDGVACPGFTDAAGSP